MAGVSNGLLTRATNLSENEKIKAPKTLKTCKFLILIMAYVFISEFKLSSCFFGGKRYWNPFNNPIFSYSIHNWIRAGIKKETHNGNSMYFLIFSLGVYTNLYDHANGGHVYVILNKILPFSSLKKSHRVVGQQFRVYSL